MGQYHIVVNLDRQEFLHPHRMGDGLKLLEFGCSPIGTMTGLAILLAASNGEGRGGGDLSLVDYHYVEGNHSTTARPGAEQAKFIVGRWAGQRIAIVGDYHEPNDVPGYTLHSEFWNAVTDERDGWVDISRFVLDAMRLDSYIAQNIGKPWGEDEPGIERDMDENGVIRVRRTIAPPAP